MQLCADIATVEVNLRNKDRRSRVRWSFKQHSRPEEQAPSAPAPCPAENEQRKQMARVCKNIIFDGEKVKMLDKGAETR